MKKVKLSILSSLLCFLMIFGSVFQVPITADATEALPTSDSSQIQAILPSDTISDNTASKIIITDSNSTECTSAENSTTEDSTTAEEIIDETITASFYDTDEKTLLYSVSMKYDGNAQYIDDYSSSSDHLGKIVRRGYQISKWYNVNKSKNYKPSYIYSSYGFKTDTTFNAVWSTTPYVYDIIYNMNGGDFSEDLEEIPSTFHVKSDTITLPKPQRKNYTFSGWYSDPEFTNRVKTIKTGTYIDSDENGNIESYQLYAKWTASKPAKVSKPAAKNNAKGKIKVAFKKVKNASGYQLVYATDKKFKKNKVVQDLGKKTSLTLTNLPTGKTLYFKVRAYKKDSTGNLCYGKYSSVRSCKVKKGVKEYTAQKNSGKLKKVMVKGKTNLYVTAVVSKRLKSSDDFYYLVKVDPNTNKILKQIAKTPKATATRFELPLKDDNGNNHVQGKFGVAIKKGSKYMLITSTAYISNPEAAATNTTPFPTPESKKGRQGCYDTSLGDKNYFMNFNLNTIIGTKSSYNVAYKYNGKTYYFYYPNLGNLAAANADGGTNTVQIMLQYSDQSKDLILPSGRTPGANYYAFNTETKAAREKLEAAFNFIAEYGSQEGYRVDNWILGNEVNTYANMNAKWYYAGNISREKFMQNYASTFRMLYYAVRSNNKNGRVYICCDHTWINRENDWGTRYFTEAFNTEIKKQNPNIKWNLAYHAYSAVLTNADFWNDGTLAPHSLEADFVSPNNLEILTSYVKNNFGEDVRIILSEQGFSCSGGVGSPYNHGRQSGESVQAAAVAYLYYKAQFNDMIDAVIFSSGDHGGAGYQFDFIGRKAENVYKYMDTPKYNKYTKNYLSPIGATSWKNIVSGFSAKKLKAMPNR